ncbi:hypothetical protein V6N11_042230 [Hibiscus sabdariffa]|uniref:Sodium/metabolite cotransporter BASS1, chloroplastic n=1 Tax=Hibiscus sabdariffa TaxID=183260 RepID=A0ABR2QVT5_9ROSI
MPFSLSCPHATTKIRFQRQTKTLSPSYTNRFISFPQLSRFSSFNLTLRSQSPKLHSRTIILLTSNSFRIHCGISSDSYSSNTKKSFRERVEWVGEVISTAFPLWFSLGCLLGCFKPGSFSWITPKWSIFGLTLTMLGIGMTLTLDDLRGALVMPKGLISGFVLQYSVMPLSGIFVSKLLNLPSHYATGLILVGCCPGATASIVVTYLARGNVALSVLMTAASTLVLTCIYCDEYFSRVMTPFLTAKLAGQSVAVDAVGLLNSTLQVVLLPILGGAFLNQYFNGLVDFFSPLLPTIAVGTVCILCGNAIISSDLQFVLASAVVRALFSPESAFAILSSGLQVVLASALLHASGFFFGYILSRVLGLDVASSRTISIEVGMQNLVLGLVLATQLFQNPLTAVPCAVSGICHPIFGSVLAGIWRRDALKQKPLTIISGGSS